MIEKLKQKSIEEIAKLPKFKQDAINAVDWSSATEEMRKKFFLTENETHNLQIVTMLTLIDLYDLNFYTTYLETDVGVTTGEAEKMTTFAFNKIFKPIAKIMENSIKEQIKNKIPNWDQTVKFIVSGGDYSNFIEQ